MTHHYLEVVARDDFLSVLHPADGWWRVSCHGALQLDVGGLIGVRVGRVVKKLRRHYRKTQSKRTSENQTPNQPQLSYPTWFLKARCGPLRDSDSMINSSTDVTDSKCHGVAENIFFSFWEFKLLYVFLCFMHAFFV